MKEVKNSGKKKILVVDDHPVFRYGLAQLINREIELTLCGEADNAAGAMKMIRDIKPDLVIVDIGLEDSSGLELTKDIVAFNKDIPVLIVSMYDENLYAERALRHGARGYVMKQETFETVITAVRRILDGGIYVSDQMSEKIIGKIVAKTHREDDSPLAVLTDREIEVLRMIGDGKSVKDIASCLHLSVNTINTYRERIKVKLNLSNYLELQKFAIHSMNNNKI